MDITLIIEKASTDACQARIPNQPDVRTYNHYIDGCNETRRRIISALELWKEPDQSLVSDADDKNKRIKKLRELPRGDGPGMTLDEVNKAVAIARGGMGPDEMCVEYFDRIAELKEMLRACLHAFECGKNVPGAVVPREEFLNKLRDCLR